MRHARVLTALAGVVLALSACGQGEGEEGGGSEPAAEAFAGQTPEQILEKASAAAKSAKSVHMKGKITEDGESFTIDMTISDAQGADGNIALGDEKIELKQVGKTMYIKGGPIAALSPKLADKWIKTSATSSDASQFANLTSMNKVFEEMLDPGGKVTRVDGKDVDGVQTVGLKDNAKSDGKTDEQGILYIAAEGEPYPLLVESTAGAGGLQFLDWNEPVKVTAPPKSQVVDQKDVAKLAGA
jgi:hypothetical protein